MHSAGKSKLREKKFKFSAPKSSVLAETMGARNIDAKARQRGRVGVGARPETDLELVSLSAALFLCG